MAFLNQLLQHPDGHIENLPDHGRRDILTTAFWNYLLREDPDDSTVDPVSNLRFVFNLLTPDERLAVLRNATSNIRKSLKDLDDILLTKSIPAPVETRLSAKALALENDLYPRNQQ